MEELEIILELEDNSEVAISLEKEDVNIIINTNLQDKEIIPTKEEQIVTPDEEFGGLSSVIVYPIPNDYIIPNGTLEIKENGSKDVTEYSNVDIKVEPKLQDKSIEIVENGTTNIAADEGYDGLKKVEVITNAIENLTEELNTYNNELSEQEEQLTNVVKALKNKVGTKTPEAGFVINEWDSGGYATKITTYGLTSIPMYGFGTTSTTITNYLNKRLIEVELNDNITVINNYAFSSCQDLVNVKLPDTITTISVYAFQGCTSLALNKLPTSLTSINAYAFQNCSSLKIKTLPNGIKSIPNCVFYGCTGLIQLSMNNVTSINGTSSSYSPFYNCTGLKAIWIGSSITKSGLNRYAFSGCTNIKKIFIDLPRATVEAFTNYQYTFMNDTSKIEIIVCNDDEGFMTKEQFDEIDWATHTG